MKRPRSVTGLLLEVTRLRDPRAATRALVVAGFTLGVGMIATGVSRLHDQHARHEVAARARLEMNVGQSGSGLTALPSLVWNGDGFGLAWADARAQRVDVYFERLSREGARVGAEVAVTRGAGEHLLPRMVFAGTEYGITWTDVIDDGDDLAVGFARVGSDGARRGDPMRLSGSDDLNFGGAVAWDGHAYGVTWTSASTRGAMSLQFTRIVPDQRPTAVRVLERNALPIGLSAIAWDGREFGVSYAHYAYQRERTETRLLRAGNDGRVLGTLALGDGVGFGGAFAMMPAADGLAMSWIDFTEDGVSSLWFARTRGERVDVRARKVRSEPVLPMLPSIVWTGDSLGVAWTEQLTDRVAVSFARVSREGAMVGTPVHVSTRGAGFQPSLVWTGRDYAVAWAQRDGRTLTIQFARLDANGQRIGNDVEVASMR